MPHDARLHFALTAETRQPQEKPRAAPRRADTGVGLSVGLSVGPDTGAAAEAGPGAVQLSFVSFEAAVQLECRGSRPPPPFACARCAARGTGYRWLICSQCTSIYTVAACVVHGERFAELRHDAAASPLPAPAGTHLALALSNGDAVLLEVFSRVGNTVLTSQVLS